MVLMTILILQQTITLKRLYSGYTGKDMIMIDNMLLKVEKMEIIKVFGFGIMMVLLKFVLLLVLKILLIGQLQQTLGIIVQ